MQSKEKFSVHLIYFWLISMAKIEVQKFINSMLQWTLF